MQTICDVEPLSWLLARCTDWPTMLRMWHPSPQRKEGCTVVVSALANTAISAPAVVQCCLLLDTLAGVEAHGAAIVAAGGLAALEAAIAAHTDDAVIVAAASSALSRLGR